MGGGGYTLNFILYKTRMQLGKGFCGKIRFYDIYVFKRAKWLVNKTKILKEVVDLLLLPISVVVLMVMSMVMVLCYCSRCIHLLSTGILYYHLWNNGHRLLLVKI